MMFLALFNAKSIRALSFWLTWMATLCIAFGADLVDLDCSAFLTGASAEAPLAAMATTIEARKNRQLLRDRAFVIVVSRQNTCLSRGAVVRAPVERKFQPALGYPAFRVERDRVTLSG